MPTSAIFKQAFENVLNGRNPKISVFARDIGKNRFRFCLTGKIYVNNKRRFAISEEKGIDFKEYVTKVFESHANTVLSLQGLAENKKEELVNCLMKVDKVLQKNNSKKPVKFFDLNLRNDGSKETPRYVLQTPPAKGTKPRYLLTHIYSEDDENVLTHNLIQAACNSFIKSSDDWIKFKNESHLPNLQQPETTCQKERAL